MMNKLRKLFTKCDLCNAPHSKKYNKYNVNKKGELIPMTPSTCDLCSYCFWHIERDQLIAPGEIVFIENSP